jgi:tetratricopeptide (TPR) repeat protein
LTFEASYILVSDHTQQATIRPIKPLFGLRQRQPMLAHACILVGLFLPLPAIGLAQGTAYVPPIDPKNEYFDEIDRIEGEYGPYASELSDLYLGLGRSLMDSGDYDEARDAFHRGVLVKRVNLGPNSPEQTNQLYLLATAETALGEQDAAEKVMDNIYFINSSHYGEKSPEMLPVLDRMHQWYLMTRPPGTLSLDLEDYQRIVELTEEAADISEAANGMSHPDTAVAYRRLAEAEFQMVRHLTGFGMPVTPEYYVARTSGSRSPPGFGSEPVYEHFKDGRRAFKKYLDSLAANESTTPPEYAEAVANLGDWCLVFERRGQSRKYYEHGYQILIQNKGYEEQAKSFMSQPRPMHFVNSAEPIYLDEIPTNLQEINLDVSITVSSIGKVRKVEVLNTPEGMSKSDLNKIVRRLRLIPFRPAMKEGEVVTTKNFIWRYAIAPHGIAS